MLRDRKKLMEAEIARQRAVAERELDKNKTAKPKPKAKKKPIDSSAKAEG